MFEKFVKSNVNPSFKHETMSKIIFSKVFQTLESSFNEYGLYERDREFIVELISPKQILVQENCDASSLKHLDLKLEETFGRGLKKAFLFEIVSNYVNGVDVDKWDYLTRDSQLVKACMENECPIFDFKSLLESSRVIGVSPGTNNVIVTHIAFDQDQINNIYSMYELRRELIYRTIINPENLAIREMLRDILLNM